VLAGSTGSVSQALQRIGRSGHSVGQVSRGKLFAFHGMDLLQAAALKDAVDERDIEEIRPIENPLDILAQLILALCAEKERNIEELYELIRKFYTFRSLNYESFNRVVRMLAGLGEKSRLRDIKPRIWLDKIEGKIGALDATLGLLYSSGGVIANRGLYSLRLADGTKIGELDEEFVWERNIGDCFDFGARGWRIVKIGSEAVEVTPLEKRADFIPFWKSDTVFRSKNLMDRVLSILDEYNRTEDIQTHLTDAARDSLKNFLDAQRMAQNGLPLTDNKNITVEIIERNELNRDFCSIIFHSFRGGEVNYPLSLALSMELSQMVSLRVESFSNDDSILFLIPRLGFEEAGSLTTEEIFRRALTALETVDSNGINHGERLFRNRLESSGVFGANFRETAERSLLLPKAHFGKRTPLWIMRQRSKRLFDAVAGEDGFPVTAEAWRSCLVDTFDMDGFRELTEAINSGGITLSFFHSVNPSPFSGDLVRMETGNFVYDYDERKDLFSTNRSATLSDKVIEEAIGNADLRPVLKATTVNDFVSRLRREIPGWAPEDALSVSEWVKERIAIPLDEWETLRAVMPETAVSEIDSNKIKTVMRNGAAIASIIHREWEENWKTEPLSLLGQWLRYEGPVSIERISSVFGVTKSEAEDAVAALVEIDEAVNDVLVGNGEWEIGSGERDLNSQNTTREQNRSSNSDSQSSLTASRKQSDTSNTAPHSPLPTPHSPLICDRENLEMLLRLSRKKERPVIKERPASTLVPFLALRQGLGADNGAFRKNLYAWTAPAKLWETEILCARNLSYEPEKTNREIREGRLVWYGAGKERIGFCRPEDLDLICDLKKSEQTQTAMTHLLASPFFNRPRDFWEIKNELALEPQPNPKGEGSPLDSRACTEALWREVWHGSLTSDSLDPVRRGIETGFIPKEVDIPQSTEPVRPFGRLPRLPSALKNKWRSGAPVHGNWFSLLMEEDGAGGHDPLEEDALNRDRVRLLLDRYGILCRPLLEHEAAPFSWSKLLPAMRRMELSGELTAGRFFAGINSLQFASPSIASELEQADNFCAIYWMNATDPASPAGLEIEGLGYPLCARSSNNRLYYKGANLIAISTKNGKELQIFLKADDPDMTQLIALLKIPRTRAVMPEKKILVEKINGEEAAKSNYAACFKEQGFESDRGRLVFW